MSHYKQVWLTAPLTIFVVFFLLLGTIATWYSERSSGSFQIRYQRHDAISSVLSPAMIGTIYEDMRLQNALLELADNIAFASSNLGDAYDSEGLKGFAKNLTIQISRLRDAETTRKKRGLLEDLGNLITGGGGNNQNGQSAGGLLSSLGNALGLGGGNSTGGLGGLLQQGLSSLGNQLIGSLDTPALFLGIGLGMGTASGLNLSDTQQNKVIAAKVASEYNASATGINLVAQNLGTGITSQLTPSLKNLAGGGGQQIGPAVFALAQGIGQGSANGLKLTNQQFGPSNGTDINTIAKNLGLGISEPIASGIDFQKLLGQTGATGGQLASQLPQIAAAAGQGLGEGASTGLGLSKTTGKRSLNTKRQSTSNQINIPQTVGEFSRGLSQSFLQSANLSQALNAVVPGASGGLGNFNLMSMLVPIASGAGKGIGEGTAIGLGFQKDSGITTLPADTSTNQSTEVIVSQFSKGLVSSFLANGTASKALATFSTGSAGLANNLQISKVAEGLARGLVEGGVNAISSVGGITSFLKGNFSSEQAMNMPSIENSNFNDSVGGAAVAFGRGLAGEGTLLISKLITNPTKPVLSKRSLHMKNVAVVPYHALHRRADSAPLAIDSNTLSSLAQAGTNAVTCQGIGGLASIALGLMKSRTLKTTSAVPLDNRTLEALPREPIVIRSEGNKFEITIQSGDIKVNEIPLRRFAILTGVHIFLTTLSFFYLLPVYLALGAVHRLSVLINQPLNEAKVKKLRRIFLIMSVPTGIIGTILGIVGMGKAQHFHTAHGVLGLIILILIPPTIVTNIRRLNTSIPLPSTAFSLRSVPKTFKSPLKIYLIPTILITLVTQLSSLTWVLGFTELRSISLCIVDAILTAPLTVAFVVAVLFLQVGAISLVGLRWWLERRLAHSSSSMAESKDNPEAGLKRASIRTFGFERSSRSVSIHRDTQQLTGREDSKIGWPSNVRRVGDEAEEDRERRMSDPFQDPENPFNPTNVAYDEKLGHEKDISGSEERYVAYRPSSEVRGEEANGLFTGYTQQVDSKGNFSRPRPSTEGIRDGHPSLNSKEARM